MFKRRVFLGNTNQNRFLLVDLRGETPMSYQSITSLSSQLCNTPIFDDLIVLSDSNIADAKMQIFGGDGLEADFCGNGALFAISILKKEKVILETGAGLKEGYYSKLGQPWLHFGDIQTNGFKIESSTLQLLRKRNIGVIDCIKSGEPHLVVFASQELRSEIFDRKLFEEIAGEISSSVTHIASGVNVTMVFHTGPNYLYIRTFERGVKRMTASCGTGSLAAARSLFPHLTHEVPLIVESPGGIHVVKNDAINNSWPISGTVTLLGSGNLQDVCDFFEKGMIKKEEQQYAVQK